MTLLGFNMGTTDEIAAPVAVGGTVMDMSLDQMIASRRNEQQPKPNKGRGNALQKSVSNTDRSIATSRAKRNAAMAARRGMTQAGNKVNSKPTAMQVEKEVQKQVQKTVLAKARAQKQQQPPKNNNNPATAGTTAPKATSRRGRRGRGGAAGSPKMGSERAAERRSQRQVTKAVAQARKQPVVAPAVISRAPTKKALNAAAVSAMQQNGFKIPQGVQMVISFAPAATTAPAPAANKTPNNNNNQKKNGGGRGKGKKN